MSKCPVCAASFPTTQFVCEYCGHVETERVKKIDVDISKEISFKDSMNIIHENLNAIQQLHRPTVYESIMGVLRIYVAIITFGIVLLFWKKQKRRFNRKEYNKLRSIVERNIKLLKLSSEGSNQLYSRIKVVETDLLDVEKKIKTSIRTKQIITFLMVGAFFTYVYFEKEEFTKSDVEVVPLRASVEGALSNNLGIIIKKYPIYFNINEAENIEEIKVEIKLKVTNKYEFSDNELLNLSMILKTKLGDSLTIFSESKLKTLYIDKVKRALKQSSNRKITLPFYFRIKSTIKIIPSEIKKFSIMSVIDTVQIR